jgi:hypothetical protein
MRGLDKQQCSQLHLLHHLLGLETLARGSDGSALLHCLGKLQPFARSLSSFQRATILGAISSQHSRVVHEATAQLLLDGLLADDTSWHAPPSVPVFLQELLLPAELQLRAIVRFQNKLLGVPPTERPSCWMQHVQVMAAILSPACQGT